MAGKTKTLFIPGKAMWCKAKEPDPEYGNYEIDWYVSDEWDKIIQDEGIQLKRRENEEGVFYKFKRKHEGMIKGELVKFGPPAIKIATGPEVDGIVPTADYTDLVGNGSEGYLKVEVYRGGKGVGTRWVGLRIDNLVEFTPDKDSRPLTPEYPF